MNDTESKAIWVAFNGIEKLFERIEIIESELKIIGNVLMPKQLYDHDEEKRREAYIALDSKVNMLTVCKDIVTELSQHKPVTNLDKVPICPRCEGHGRTWR